MWDVGPVIVYHNQIVYHEQALWHAASLALISLNLAPNDGILLLQWIISEPNRPQSHTAHPAHTWVMCKQSLRLPVRAQWSESQNRRWLNFTIIRGWPKWEIWEEQDWLPSPTRKQINIDSYSSGNSKIRQFNDEAYIVVVANMDRCTL